MIEMEYEVNVMELLFGKVDKFLIGSGNVEIV